MKTTRVIVVGGGFAGIKVVREMANIPGISLTLISDQLDFRYSPALWRTATGGSKRESSIPILDLVAKVNNGRFVQAKVTKIDRAKKIIITEDGQKFDYDFCVLALGVVTSYFGIEGLDVFSYSIKSAHEVERLKRHLHEQLTHDHKFDKSYAIVGAGPTGVELAAALGEYLRKIAKRHKIRADKVKIELIEAADRILPSLSAKAAEKAGKRLEKLGVNVLTKQKVMGATKNTLKVDNRIVHTHTVVWTAGVTNNPFFKENADQFTLNEKGKVVVDDFMLVDDSVFVIGDNAGVQYSGLALTAIHHAKYVAKSLKTLLTNNSMPAPIKTLIPLSAIPVGGRWAVVEYRGIVFGGWLGGVARSFGDLIGYADVMGWIAALKLWSRHDQYEETCSVCNQPQVTQ